MNHSVSKSSSWHSMTGDSGIPFWKKPIWYGLNQVQNLWFPQRVGSHLRCHGFSPRVSEEDWSGLRYQGSPSRLLSDLFWSKLPWSAIEEELGAIRLVDVGCGKGGYAKLWQGYSGGKISTYTGMDVRPREEWKILSQESPWMRFVEVNSNRLESFLPEETNLVFSQSAIEHFEEDLVFFDQLSEWSQKRKRSVIQVHLMPSAACLWLYGLHGVRQYTPRRVSELTHRYAEFSECHLYALGGDHSNRLHEEWITRPRWMKQHMDRLAKFLKIPRGDLRDKNPEGYRDRVRQAMEQDFREADGGNPAFYAMVLHFYPRNRSLWEKL